MNTISFNPTPVNPASPFRPRPDYVLLGYGFYIRVAGEYYTGEGFGERNQAELYHNIDVALLDAEELAFLHPDLHVEIVDAETDAPVYHTPLITCRRQPS
jgi:hypothetical protein